MTTTVGTITHAEVVTGEPVAVGGTQKILRRLVLTDADGRQWGKNVWLAACDEPEQYSPSREKASVLESLFAATPTQLEEFEQDDVEIRWPELGVVCPKTETFWFFNFDLVKTKQEEKEWEAIWIQMEIDDIEKEQRIFEMMTVRTEDQSREEYSRSERKLVLQRRLGEITPLSPDKTDQTGGTGTAKSPFADPPEQPKDDESTNRPPNKTAKEREQRLLVWAEEEFSLRGKIGTIQRVANREGVRRQMITRILQRFTEGRKFLETLKRA
ncbi:MAG: hypothetical protein HQL90_07290 [Magnetococcales bacterium]|nr:hypothetical protein [Magnetococcales bacterium]